MARTSLFIELLQVALGQRERLSQAPPSYEWEALLEDSIVQTVTGVLLNGIERLPTEQRPETDLLLEWIGEVQIIEALNEHHGKVLQKTYSCLEKGRLKVAFMKGLVCGARYPNPKRRQCGDIDFVVAEKDFSRTLDLLEGIGEVDRSLVHEHHGMAFVDNVTLEPHYKVHNYQNPKVDKAMKELFEEVFPERLVYVKINGGRIPVFPVAFEGVMLTGHMVNHVYAEGLGLRQVIDFYYWLTSFDLSSYSEELWRGLRMMRMERAFRVFVRICKEYLGMPSEVIGLEYTEREKRFAKKMMKDIMTVGNFGRGERNVGDNRWLKPLRSYLWVLHRCWKLGYLCPAEAKWWPVSKFLRYGRKHMNLYNCHNFIHK